MGIFTKENRYKKFDDFNREELIDEIVSQREASEDTARNTRITNEDIQRRNTQQISDMKDLHKKEVEKLTTDHELALKKKEFEITHNSDVRVKDAEGKVIEMSQKLAVAESENKMLREIADLNGDILDIKDLVTKLIDKLPEIKLNSLTVAAKDTK